MFPESKLQILRDRAQMFAQARNFFAEKGVVEVDVPILSKGAPVDTYIDVMSTSLSTGEVGYLHTSPEYAMKRLLSQGIGDIYQMSHVFRDGDIGHLHNPEFTMVEWYRIGMTFPQLIEETLDFIRLFIGPEKAEWITYREAFKRYAGIDYISATVPELIACAPDSLPKEAASWEKEVLLHYFMGFVIEPNFQNLTVIKDYPPSQAALAKMEDGVALRFEVYFKGVELANGFHELTDAKEQRRRFHEDNEERLQMGKKSLPLDENFLQALEMGLPDCCGVAVGFDRLMLLRHNKKHLEEVLPFAWHQA